MKSLPIPQPDYEREKPLVIGGLIKSSDIETVTKIPLLGDIPIIGELFTLRNKTHEETELIIFLTPSLVAY